MKINNIKLHFKTQRKKIVTADRKAAEAVMTDSKAATTNKINVKL